MSTAALITTIIFIVTILFLVFEPIDPIITGALIPAVLVVFGIIEPKSAYSNFANTTIVFFISLVVIGEAFFVTGLADYLGEKVIGLMGKSEKGIILGTGVVAGGLSGFLNDTGTTGCLMPIVSAMGKKTGVSNSKLFMALAYFASLGGTMTLAGTTPHILVNGILSENGHRGFSFFEYMKLGLPLLIMGIIYMVTIGFKLLPDKETIEVRSSDSIEKNPKKMALVGVIFLFVLVAMATEIVPMHIAAVLGAVTIVLSGCLNVKEAVNTFSVKTVFLVGGIFPLSIALGTSGAAAYFIGLLEPILIGKSPIVILGGISLIMIIATQLLTNSAATVLILPIGLVLADASAINPLAVAMAVSLGASGAFMTPFGTGPNLLVWEAGGYGMKDYAKCGFPLTILFWLLSTALCGIFYL